MGLVTDTIDRADALADARHPWEKVWNDTLKYVLPMGGKDFTHHTHTDSDLWHKRPRAEERGREIFDSTSVWAVDRLTAGLESLATPQTEKWHGLGSVDPLAPEPTHDEAEWYDRYRDYLFAARYAPRAGFALSNQQAIRSTIALGTGVYAVQEAFGDERRDARAAPFSYRPIPLRECYIAVNSEGVPDTLFRRVMMTARQIVQRYGSSAHEKVRAAADNDKDKDKKFQIIHAVFPRAERGSSGLNTVRNSLLASVTIDVDHKHLIGDSGYFEFPYVVYYWQQDGESGYGESPVMLALAEIKSLNLLSKHTMRAVQQWTNPPLGIPNDGVVRRPNLNPGAVNPGAIDDNGRQRIQPIVTSQNPNFIQQVLEVKREQLRESLYINLFQILIENPQMTATEALIRANEKGELLGPAGGRIQAGLSQMVERETGILQRKGAFEGESPLAPPESVSGRPFDVTFTSPLDRLRRANELVGVQQTMEFAGQIAQFDQSILDRIDTDQALDLAQEITGAPRRIFRSDDEVAELREQRAQQEQQAQALAIAEQAGAAANQIIPAVREGADLVGELGGAPAEPA